MNIDSLPAVGEQVRLVGDHPEHGKTAVVVAHDKVDGRGAFRCEVEGTGMWVGVTHGWQWVYASEQPAGKRDPCITS